jgi:hypothetical protein
MTHPRSNSRQTIRDQFHAGAHSSEIIILEPLTVCLLGRWGLYKGREIDHFMYPLLTDTLAANRKAEVRSAHAKTRL